MKKILFFAILLIQLPAFAQEDAWVYFTNKPQAEFYLANPLEMLSQKALDRRAVQSIALDDQDVPVHAEYIEQIANSEGISVMARSKWLNALHIRGSVANIVALTSLPFVASIDFADNSLDGTGRMAPPKKISPVNKVQDATVDFNYGASANQMQMLNGHKLHQQNFTGTGMTIAVLDAGFPGVNTTQPFERLQENNFILGGYNFVSRSNDFYSGGSHGSLVLSTMGGYVEGQLVGTAPDAFYYLFVTEDPTSENPVEESLWVEAAEMADSLGVDVINTSLGYFSYDNPAYSYTYEDINGETAFLTRGANIAFTRGMFLVNSAGNTGATINTHITVPADAFNTLAVGAVDASGQYASFSSVGPTFDMRVKPDVVAQGLASTIANSAGTVTTANGTSASSPIVAGLVACLWQALPGKTNTQILQLIRQSADRFFNPTPQYGYGIPDFGLALQNGLGTEAQEDSQYAIYPNPAYSDVYVALPEGVEHAIVFIYNSLGQQVLQNTLSADVHSFSVAPLAEGMYFYRVEAGTETYQGRLLKQ